MTSKQKEPTDKAQEAKKEEEFHFVIEHINRQSSFKQDRLKAIAEYKGNGWRYTPHKEELSVGAGGMLVAHLKFWRPL